MLEQRIPLIHKCWTNSFQAFFLNAMKQEAIHTGYPHMQTILQLETGRNMEEKISKRLFWVERSEGRD